MTQHRTRVGLIAGAIAAVATVGGMGGCAGYATYPRADGSTAISDLNSAPVNTIMATSLAWAAYKYPVAPEGEQAPFAINLPEGVKPETYDYVVRQIGGGAVPLTHDTADLPTFHIGLIRVRGDEAQVDVLRPVLELSPSPAGETVYQQVTVRLEGGLSPWRVVGRREWTVGAFPTPAPNYYDDLLNPPAPEPEPEPPAEEPAETGAEE